MYPLGQEVFPNYAHRAALTAPYSTELSKRRAARRRLGC
jgi:hypothetical protein